MEVRSNAAIKQCRIDLLGGLRVHQGGHVITRFDAYKTGALLAYLALYRDRMHSREALAELFWPDSSPIAGRNSLKQALSCLRRHLEPAGAESASVLYADRIHLGLNPAAVITDAAEFEAALESAVRQPDTQERASLLAFAAELYGGELLPGYYETWVLTERERFGQAYLGALRQLVEIHRQRQEWTQAIDAAYRVVAAEPLLEEGHQELIRLLAAAGQPAAAVRQYHELERHLREELEEEPSEATHDLVRHLLEDAIVAAAAATTRRAVRGVDLRTAPFVLAADSGRLKPSMASAAATRGTDSEPVRAVAGPREETAPSAAPALPVPLTGFFGREKEVSQLAEMLGAPSHRLITLTGLGGSGKTRLALEVARHVSDAFPGGIWFVPLAPVTDAERIADAICEALGQESSDSQEPFCRLLIQRQPSLLVLDNFEHLTRGGSAIVREFLERVPSLTCLVTSRQRLLLAGEQEFPLRPLPTPAHPGMPERLMEFASVQLFVDRARAAAFDFQLTQQNAEAVAQLCHWLEGIPLAIELAAARAGVLTPLQMLEQLSRRFDFLVSRRGDIVERHRTLRAALDWSYQMLLPDIQEFFSRLSVFRGGWTAEAAEAVSTHKDALDCLEYLKDFSLILTEEAAGVIRFRFLETLREFAWEQLDETERADLRQRHAEFFFRLCEEAEPHLCGSNQERWLYRLEAEHENIQTALEWHLRCRRSAEGNGKGDTARVTALLQQIMVRREGEHGGAGESGGGGIVRERETGRTVALLDG